MNNYATTLSTVINTLYTHCVVIKAIYLFIKSHIQSSCWPLYRPWIKISCRIHSYFKSLTGFCFNKYNIFSVAYNNHH